MNVETDQKLIITFFFTFLINLIIKKKYTKYDII